MPICSGDCFEIFLEELSKERPNELMIIVVDNAAFHKHNKLTIPENIQLIFQPPYSPELNPAERMWREFKRAFTNKTFKTLDQVSDFIAEQVNALTPEQVMSITQYPYIFLDVFWIKI
jgi:transposase